MFVDRSFVNFHLIVANNDYKDYKGYNLKIMKKSWMVKYEGLILIVLGLIVLRIPSLFEPYWYGDEGIYLTLGMALRKGLVFYRDIHDNKPPLLYLTAALAQTQFWFRFILLWWQAAATVAVYKLAEIIFTGDKNYNNYKNYKTRGALFVTAVFVGLVTVFEGNIANGEIFMILPVTVAMLIILNKNYNRYKYYKYLIAGLLFAAGFLFKVPAGFDFLAAAAFLILIGNKDYKDYKSYNKIVLMAAGFVLPILISVAYYTKQGAFEPYVRSALMQNIGYLQSWKTGNHSSSGLATESGLAQRGAGLILATAAIWWSGKRLGVDRRSQFAGLWFGYSLFGALLSQRPYPHYLIQAAAPAALLAGLVIYGKQTAARAGLAGLGAAGVMAYFSIGFWGYPILPYYQNFLDFSLMRKTRDEYFSYFGNRVVDNYRMAGYLRAAIPQNGKAQEDERIFVWGDEPFIYPLAGRLPAGRYTTAYHVADFNGYTETIEQIDKTRPAAIVKYETEERPFPQLDRELEEFYIRGPQFGDAVVYHRLTDKPINR